MNHTQNYLRVALALHKSGDIPNALLHMNAACVTAKLEMPFEAPFIRQQRDSYRATDYLRRKAHGQDAHDVRR